MFVQSNNSKKGLLVNMDEIGNSLMSVQKEYSYVNLDEVEKNFVVKKGRLILGILCLAGAVLMWDHVDSNSKIKDYMGICSSVLNKIDNGVFDEDCFKTQLLYYSPWLLGIMGIIFCIKYRPHYYGTRYRSYHRNYGKYSRKNFGNPKVRGPTDWTKNRFRRVLGI